MDSEDDLLARINRRDISVYKVLYADYYNAWVLYAVQFVGQTSVAEDIVQELFVSIWEKQVTFLSFTSFRVYCYNAIRNAAIDYLRHQDVEAQYLQALGETYKEVSDEMDLREEEVRRLLYREIDHLPTRMRQIFLLYMEGRKNEEIADMLQLSVETVKTQKKRAVRQIKARLGSLFFFLSVSQLLP